MENNISCQKTNLKERGKFIRTVFQKLLLKNCSHVRQAHFVSGSFSENREDPRWQTSFDNFEDCCVSHQPNSVAKGPVVGAISGSGNRSSRLMPNFRLFQFSKSWSNSFARDNFSYLSP